MRLADIKSLWEDRCGVEEVSRYLAGTQHPWTSLLTDQWERSYSSRDQDHPSRAPAPALLCTLPSLVYCLWSDRAPGYTGCGTRPYRMSQVTLVVIPLVSTALRGADVPRVTLVPGRAHWHLALPLLPLFSCYSNGSRDTDLTTDTKTWHLFLCYTDSIVMP